MNGFMIGNEGVSVKLTKGETKLMFNQLLNTKGGFVSGIKMVPVLIQVANVVVEPKKMIKIMSAEINKLYKILGYCGGTHLKAKLRQSKRRPTRYGLDQATFQEKDSTSILV
jgi:hypothetical protein